MSQSPPTVLIIGATGGMGLTLIQAFAAHPQRPPVHAFCRTPSKLPADHSKNCASIQKGDACNSEQIQSALLATNANIVIVSVGIPGSAARTDLRERSAKALYAVLQKPEFQHVRVVIVSAVGTGGSKIRYGWGFGTFAKFLLRHVIRDHDEQERVLGELGERCWIVRPMGLGDGEGGGVVEFEGKVKYLMVQRKDLAEWMVREILGGKRWGGSVSVTGGEGKRLGQIVGQIFIAMRNR